MYKQLIFRMISFLQQEFKELNLISKSSEDEEEE